MSLDALLRSLKWYSVLGLQYVCVLWSTCHLHGSDNVTLSFVLKHRLTVQCFTDLLAVIEAHCPKPNYCKTSVRKLFDHFKNIKGNLVKHMICTFCKGYICEQRQTESVTLPDSCRICDTSLANNTSFFLEAPLADQIAKLFKG